MTANGHGVSFGVDENVPELESDDGCTASWIYNKTPQLYPWKGWILWYLNYISILQNSMRKIGGPFAQLQN